MPLRKRRKEGIMPSELRPGAKAPAFTLPRDGGGTTPLLILPGANSFSIFIPAPIRPVAPKRRSTSIGSKLHSEKPARTSWVFPPTRCRRRTNSKLNTNWASRLLQMKRTACSRPTEFGRRNPCTAGSSWASYGRLSSSVPTNGSLRFGQRSRWRDTPKKCWRPQRPCNASKPRKLPRHLPKSAKCPSQFPKN